MSLAAAPLLGCGGGGNPPPDDGWDAGPVEHLLPTASHRRIRLKVSLRDPLAAPPLLSARGAGAEQRAAGHASTADGRFFAFDVDGLAPATELTLQLHRPGGDPLCDPWPLRTFPAPDAELERLRLLLFTCAGGLDDLRSQRPVPSGTLVAEELVRPIEENGFSLLDVTPDALELSQFRWTPDQGEAALDTLEPFHVQTIPR